MNICKKSSLNLIKKIFFIVILNITSVANVYAEKFVVTGHVYANINEFEYILNESKNNNINSMFLLGDMKSEVLNRIPSYEDKYDIKIYTVPGNHEVSDDKNRKDYIEKFGNYRSIIKGRELYVLLNTMENNSRQSKFNHAGYGIEGKQLEFLKSTINSVDKNITTINIFMHHSLFIDKLTQKEIQSIINNPSNKLNLNYIQKQKYLSNDLVKNNWYQKIHEFLKREVTKGRTINVFSGDNSLSLHFLKDKVNYFLTGLRQYYKSPLHIKNMQSYIVCDDKENCDIKFFNNHTLTETLDLLYDNKPTSIIKFNKNNEIKLNKNITSKYLFLEKKDGSNCSFPTYITLENNIARETFSGLKTSKNRMIIFTNNKKNEKYFDTVLREQNINISLYLNPDLNYLLEEQNEDSFFCEELTLKIYNNDITKLNKYMKRFDTYKVKMSSFELTKLYAKTPTRNERYKSKFKFQKASGKIKFKDNKYKIKIKPRGGTWFHWENKKKSYTIKANKNSKPTKLFYIPEKRAMLGEHLIQKIGKFIDLQSLNSTFGHLEINGENNGFYYISDDFDKHFLIENNLPEGNIYHTDPYKTDSNYNVSDIKKNVFLGNIKKYNSRFDTDIDYFMKTINQDNFYLSNNWKYHFDQENLVKMLALYLFSGTTHYNLHNMYFYINPVNGKIYFFPWDFMNIAHGESLKFEDVDKLGDYKNFNQIFAKLLEIKEIRYLRNKFIYEQADSIINFIEKFENEEVPHIFMAMLFDNTIPLNTGADNQKSFLEFTKISQRIKDNIKFLQKKLEKNHSELDVKTMVKDGTAELNINLLSYAGIEIKCITIIYSDNNKPNCYKKGTKLFSDIEYHKSHRANIKLKSTSNKIKITTPKNKAIRKVTVDYSNIFNGITKKVNSVLIQEKHEKTVSKVKNNLSLYPNILIQKSDQLYFRSDYVVLKENLILPEETTLNILPGTQILLDKGVSIISYGSIIVNGKKDKKVTFSPLKKHQPWGTIALVGNDTNRISKSVFQYCVFDGGSGANEKGGYFSAMLAAHYVKDITIKNCIFKNASKKNGGDDAVNVKYGKVMIKDSLFKKNSGDGIDFDFVDENSSIINSNFIDNKNDAIDVSSSLVFIENCNINNSGDKGISVGEKSNININDCQIFNSKIGIATKDSSFVNLSNSTLEKNIVGIGLYNKKEYYKSSSIRVVDTKIENNYINCGEETYNKFGHSSAKIILDKKIKTTNNEYDYIININTKGISKKDIIRTFYENRNFDKYINFITFRDCNVSK